MPFKIQALIWRDRIFKLDFHILKKTQTAFIKCVQQWRVDKKVGTERQGKNTHQRSPDQTQTPPAALQPMLTCPPCELNWRPRNRFLMNTKKLLCAAIFNQISCVLIPFLRPADCAFCIWKEKKITHRCTMEISVSRKTVVQPNSRITNITIITTSAVLKPGFFIQRTEVHSVFQSYFYPTTKC